MKSRIVLSDPRTWGNVLAALFLIVFFLGANYPGNASFGSGTPNLGTDAFSQGTNCQAPGASAFASGSTSLAGGIADHSEGYYTSATGGLGAHAEGQQGRAEGEASHVEGFAANTPPSGINAHAEGQSTIAYYRNSHAEGEDAIAWAYRSHAQNQFTQAFGTGSTATGNYSIAGGDNSQAGGEYSIASRTAQWALASANYAGAGDSQLSILHLIPTLTLGAQGASEASPLLLAGNAPFYSALEDGKIYTIHVRVTVAAIVGGVRKIGRLDRTATLFYSWYDTPTYADVGTSVFHGDSAISSAVLRFTAGGNIEYQLGVATSAQTASARVDFEEVITPDWTPMILRGHGLMAWWTAESGVTPGTDGSATTAWVDKSGVSSPDSWNHVPYNLQGTGGNGPTFVAHALNVAGTWKAALRFDGSSQYMDPASGLADRSLNALLGSNGNIGSTVLLVARVTSVSTNDADPRNDAAIFGDTLQKWGLSIRSADLSSMPTLQSWNDDGSGPLNNARASFGGTGVVFLSTTTDNLVRMHTTIGAIGNQVTAAANVDPAGLPSTLNGIFQLGRSGGSTPVYAAFDLFEVYVVSRAVTQGALQNLMGYAGREYGLLN